MLRLALGAAAMVFALAVVWHTASFLARHRPVLPIYDGWAPWSDLDAVLHGRTTPFRALIGRHNEHRALLASLLFFADLLDGGRDRAGVAASLAAQALQAALLLCPAEATERRHMRRLLAGSAPLALLPFTMGNGLLAGPVCALVAWMDGLPARRRILCLTSALAAVSTVVDLSLPLGNVSGTALALTPRAALHALAYIGGAVTSGRVPWALAAGGLGVGSSAAALLMVLRAGLRSRTEAVALRAVLFVLASAGATAAGRIRAGLGVEQALSGRYATGSAAFWSATLVLWAARLAASRTADPGGPASRRSSR